MTWFVMRDLTRANASRPAWKELTDAGLRVFTPMVWKIRKRGVRTERYKAPAIHDLLFVDSTRAELDPEVARRATLQYRFVRGGAHGEAMTVNIYRQSEVFHDFGNNAINDRQASPYRRRSA